MVVYCHPWTALRISTAQEEHGSGRRLLRICYRIRPTRFGWLAVCVALGVSAAIARLDLWLGAGALSLTAVLSTSLLWRGRRLAHDVVAVFDELALELGMLRCASADAATGQAAAPVAG